MDKNEQQMPRLGEPVPAFEAMTTQGKVSFPADYKGKWVILFSHPADFTPICTSEVLTFGARTAEFKGVLRAMIYYPLALGRNFDEIKRVLVGLQAIDAFGVAMPADWRPGDEVIVPMKGEDMNDQPEGVKCYDWFFCTRPLPKEEIEKKLGKGYEIKG